ncbi:type II secretion protein F [Actinotalea solisilvae]|uniref:type II secretion protein F n=1 Tax=Actinotalea solisilvae TaxID=2072922 RepID=UPI0018F177E0|nr:type II secretion protein F [Actinotalea solisilvae]
MATLTAVAAALRGGAVPEEAWRRAGVRAPLGVPQRGALLARWPGQSGALATVLAAAELTTTLGVAPATVLDQVATSLARDAEAAGQRRAALAGPVATARLLGGLPVLGLGLGVALGADPVAVLLDGGAGSTLLVAGGLLLLVGHRWTARCVTEARGEVDG